MQPETVGASWALPQWLQYQETLHPRGIELGLARVRTVAQALGLLTQPPLTLIIGGTNGKGSSATLAARICEAAGRKVGLYTSPHLLRYNERVAVNGVEASDAALCAAFQQIDQARTGLPLTYFEFGTLAALLLFRDAGVSVQILEVGLGGRLDAVNMLDADAALVTNIGLDHLDWLGPDRESIGREKAGIFRAGRPSICADANPPASLGGAQYQLHRDFDLSNENSTWTWRCAVTEWRGLPLPGLMGAVQLQNAAGVLALLHSVPRLEIQREHVVAALPQLKLAGRFEQRGNVILDVAHNAESASVLADNVLSATLPQPVRVVLGMLSDKPVERVGEELARFAHDIYLGSLPGPRGLSAEQLAARLSRRGLHLQVHPSVTAAYNAASAGVGGTVIVTGSFLTVAEVAQILHE